VVPDRDHVDMGFESRISADTRFSASLLYNRAINNNILSLTKAEFAANPNLDYTNVVPQHLASGNENTTANFGTSSANLSTPAPSWLTTVIHSTRSKTLC